jgi:serine/threonine protein phosphatase PrpC
MRYSTPDNWAQFLKDTEGVDVSGTTIRNRLKEAQKISITGRNKVGRVLKGSFYSESDVREILADLLMKPEEKKEKAIQALASHGITDRPSLLAFGPIQFKKTDFPPFGKGTAFASVILGEVVRPLKLEHLERIADVLVLPQISEETKQQCLTALASHGITDRQSLLIFGINQFRKTDFPPFGKGTAFIATSLSEVINHLKLEHLERIADTLGFSKITEAEAKQQCLTSLASHGIADRQSLLAFGPVRFKKTDFPHFDKGTAFATAILGESVYPLKLEHLKRIADKLGFSKITEDEAKQKCLTALASHGITDRKSLLVFGIVNFTKTDFPPFGKGAAFTSAVLGETVNPLKLEHLKHIADVLFGRSESNPKSE